MADNGFSFGGVSSTTRKVRLLESTYRKRAALRVPSTKPVPGRDGTPWAKEEGYDDIDIDVKIQLLAGATQDSIAAWLTGRGWLQFTAMPGKAYRARALKEFSFDVETENGVKRRVATVTFTCHPHPFAFPLPSYSPTKGQSITNPTTRPAESKITIAGSGDITLSIGPYTLAITGLASKICIDMEARVAYHPDNLTQNLSPKVSKDDWPLLIPPGSNVVTWTGNVTSVTIIAYWGYI